MDQLAALLSAEIDITSLSEEDLATRLADLREAAHTAREGELTADISALIRTAAEQVGLIRAEQDARAEAAAQIVSDADEAIALLDASDPDPENPEPEADPEAEPEAEPEADPAVEPEVAAPEAEIAEPIAASAPRRAPVKNVTVPARSRPRARASGDLVMVASGEVKGVTAGHQFANQDEMHRALHEKWLSMRGTPDGIPHHVATIDWSGRYGDDRTIGGGDAFEVSNKLMGYLEQRNEEFRNRAAAMAASGGVPGPNEPNYNVATYGQSDRPLVAGLPSVKMSRGGTVFNTSPVLSAVVLDSSVGAIGTVTSAQDLAGATKDVQEIPAPVQDTATVEAETLRWSQGNFADRFLPEWTAAFMRLGLTAFARHNDALRLADIKSKSTLYTDTPAKFGAYRDLKRAVLAEMEELTDLIRDYAQPIRILLPEYVPAILATDLIAQQPGDNAWSITEEQVRRDIEGWDPMLNVTWLKDSIRGRLSTTPSGQSPRSPGFDADVEWAMFPEGAFVYGDGGSLDLGILRDTVVSATNKFQTFYEQWECLFRLVPASLCFWNTSSLCADGDSQAATDIAVCSPQGS